MPTALPISLSDALHFNGVAAVGLAFVYYATYSVLKGQDVESSRFFRWNAIGWSFNVVYLSWADLSRRVDGNPLTTTELPLMLLGNLSSLSFFLSSRKVPGAPSAVRPLLMVVVAVLLLAPGPVEILAFQDLSISTRLSAILAALAQVSVVVAYTFLLREGTTHQAVGTRLLITAPLVVFGLVQLRAMAPSSPSDLEFRAFEAGDNFWFSIGTLCKGGHLAGLLLYLRTILSDYRRALKDLAQNRHLYASAQMRLNLLDQLAHEINTPALELRLKAPVLDAALAREQHNADVRMTIGSLVEQIVSPIDAFYQQLEPDTDAIDQGTKVCNLNSICDAVIMHLKTVTRPASNIQRLYSTGPTVSGRRGELFQIARNLIKNAIEATDADRGQVKVITRIVGDRAVLRVEDDGPGVDEAIRERVFEDGFSTKGGKGRGHGLHIVKTLVENHGGRISVDPATPNGAAFEVSFPFVKDPRKQ